MITEAGRKYLIFTLQEQRFALDLSQVAEVSELQHMWPIPSAPLCYPGAINAHGSIVAVMDLNIFLGRGVASRPEKLITLDSHVASLAFQVEHVVRITTPDEAVHFEEPLEKYTAARLILSDGEAALLDAAAIVERAAESING